MGRHIVTNNVDKWEVVSNVNDRVVADFKSEAEMKYWLAQEHVYNGKLEAIRLLLTYPNRWTINGETDYEFSMAYNHWYDSILGTKTYGEYYKKIDAKLNELVTQLGEVETI